MKNEKNYMPHLIVFWGWTMTLAVNMLFLSFLYGAVSDSDYELGFKGLATIVFFINQVFWSVRFYRIFKEL